MLSSVLNDTVWSLKIGKMPGKYLGNIWFSIHSLEDPRRSRLQDSRNSFLRNVFRYALDILHEAIFTFFYFDHIHFILKQNLSLTIILD